MVPPEGMGKKKSSYFAKTDYKILKLENVVERMPGLIEQAKDLLGLNEDQAIAVLRYF